MKKDGTIPGMIAKINVLLARISIGDLHKRMIVDCSLSTKKTYEEAEAAVDARLSELEYFLNHGYDEQMAIIDEKIAAYYNLYASRISMIRNNSINTQNYLTKLLGIKGHAAGGAGPDTDGLVTEHAARFLPSGRETLLRAADPEKD